MEKNIYISSILKRRIVLKPEYINKNYEKNIEDLLKYEVGDKCIEEGYVKKDTIKIIKRSVAKVVTNNFSGSLVVDIIYSADICNPVRGNVIDCTITRINKLGLQAENIPLSIIIAKQYHNNKDIFKNLKVGQKIEAFIIGKRYFLNDKVIEIVGKLTTDTNINKKIRIKKILPKPKEMTNIFQEIPSLNEEQPVEELESIEEASKEEETEEEEEEDISDMEEDISDENDLLESDIEEDGEEEDGEEEEGEEEDGEEDSEEEEEAEEEEVEDFE